jgi:hypothetical protein
MMMSRTACCFVALGISFAAFAAACGDDDGGGGTGGNGGNGASGGSGGSAGSAGAAGEGGTAGVAGSGTAGSGTAGSGTAGSGTAGSGTAGNGNAGAAGGGTVEGGDAGPDSGIGNEPDSGVVSDAGQPPGDSGVNGNCPDFATTTAQTVAQNSQPVAIVRVTFNGDATATVVLRSTDSADVGGFTLGDIAFICTGPADADCVDAADHGSPGGQLALNAELTLTNVPGLDAAEGELVLTSGGNGLPSDPTTGTLAYVAWGADFTSPAPAGVGLLSWEDRAVLDTFWNSGDRIAMTGVENTFVCGGDTASAASFAVCTADQL